MKNTIPILVQLNFRFQFGYLFRIFRTHLFQKPFYVLSTVRTSPIECLFFAFKNFIVNSNTFSVVPLSTYAAHSHEQTMIILRVRQKNGLLQMQYTFSKVRKPRDKRHLFFTLGNGDNFNSSRH